MADIEANIADIEYFSLEYTFIWFDKGANEIPLKDKGVSIALLTRWETPAAPVALYGTQTSSSG